MGIVLPLCGGGTPAYAQPRLEITKTHSAPFTRGGEGIYTITVTNTGDQTPSGGTSVRDTLPAGLIAVQVEGGPVGADGNPVSCFILNDGRVIDCAGSQLAPGQGIEIFVRVAIASDAPCSVTNVAQLSVGGAPAGSASDPTTITGSGCGNGGGGGGGDGSILPINISGILPLFNNISTNNNISSPGASNTTRQDFALNP
ncbi:hypothetical protein AB0892_08200 [Streptomyces sp. NPDC005409]|uniref:hypothetical protein n=1 Tax=Streptomyces sp. NPDC005409 TaxID=3155342 RepID=UPI0034570807